MEQIVKEKQDSISVSKTSTGKFSFDVKIYYDIENTKPTEIIKKIENILEELGKKFKNVE